MLKELLEKYLKENLFPKKEKKSLIGKKFSLSKNYNLEKSLADESISSYINENREDENFQTKLFSLIDSKNLKDSDVYKKVNIDRRLFSKIRSNKDYHPSKETVILLGIALELSEEEIEKLLELSSYSLPKNNTYDLIIRFCFKERIYDLNQINDFLYDHDCKPLNV